MAGDWFIVAEDVAVLLGVRPPSEVEAACKSDEDSVELENTNDLLAVEGSEGRVGVALEEEEEAEKGGGGEGAPGMDMMEAVRVSVDIRSLALRADWWTGVKALISLFCRWRVRGKVGRRGMAGVSSWGTCSPEEEEEEGTGGRVWEEREGGPGLASAAAAAAPCIARCSGELWWGAGEVLPLGGSVSTRLLTLPDSMRSEEEMIPKVELWLTSTLHSTIKK